MADAQIAIIDGDQTQVVLAPGENPAIVTSIPGPQGPAGAGVPLGGTTNQVLFKQSGTNYDTAWGPITSAMIGDLEIVNADVSASAAIAGTKISPNFGSQTIQTTGVFSHALGTAGAPTITFTGDTNTGIYSPGADQLALSTNGNGRLFISSNGTITTSQSVAITGGLAAWNAGLNLFSPSSGVGQIAASTDAAGTAGTLIFQTGSERLRITSTGQLSHIGAGSSGSPAVSFSGSAPSNSLVIDSSGNIGIGQSSVTAVFGRTVSNTGAAAATYRVAGASTSAYLFVSDGLGYGGIFQESNHPFIFGVFSGERARIRADGTFEIKGGGTAGVSPAFSVNPSATSNSLVISSTGLVGVGTSAPAAIFSSKPSASSTTAATTFTGDGLFIDCANTTDGNGNYGGAISWSRSGSSTTRTAAITNVQTGSDSDVQGLAFLTHSSGTSTNPLIEAMRITGAGLVGIGTTSPGAILHTVNTSAGAATVGAFIQNSSLTAGTEVRLGFAPNSNLVSDNRYSWIGAVNDTGSNGSSLTFATTPGGQGATERMRIDGSGRLLVGTATARSNFAGNTATPLVQIEGVTAATASSSVVRGAADATGPTFNLGKTRGASVGLNTAVVSGDQCGVITFQGADGTNLLRAAQIEAAVDNGADGTALTGSEMPGRLVFSVTRDGQASPTEALRINNAGNVLIGTASTTTVQGVANFKVKASSATASDFFAVDEFSTACFQKATTVSQNQAIFVNGNGTVGSIVSNGSATAYNTSSDYRLKENVTPVTDGITRLQQLKPSRFNFIADPTKTVDGFIAHEVQTIVPEAITGEKDAVDDNGNPVYQGIDQSKLVPLLTAALQEAIGEIESLKARLDAANL